MPLFSVVIPLYNKEPHIGRAVNSVLAQSVSDFEIVIIDDGSTDKSAYVVKSFTDPRIRLIHQQNSGVSAARNRGIREAKADLIAFLDADDEWTTSFLETILRLREKYPEAGAYTTSYLKYYKFKHLKPRCKAIPPHPWEGQLSDYFKSVVKGHPPFCASSICVPKPVLLDIGGFPEGIWLGEDSDTWARIALKYTIVFSWDVGAVYYLDSENMATKKKKYVKELPFIQVARKMIEKGKISKEKSRYLTRYIKDIEFKFGICNWKAREYRESVHNFSNCGDLLLSKLIYYVASQFYRNCREIIQKRRFS